MKRKRKTTGIRTLPALVASLIAVAAIQTAAALTKVDVLVAYDTTASAWLTANSKTGDDFAKAQVEKMNTVLANSGLKDTFAFRCVGTHDGAFSYNAANGLDGTLESALKDDSAAEWTALRTARDTVGADIVVILVNKGETSGQMGTSVKLQPDQVTHQNLSFKDADWYFTEFYPPLAYAVCDVVAAQDGYVVMHEVGHIMGAGHPDILDSDHGPQLFPSSSAYMYDGANGTNYTTVMGYNFNKGKSYEVLPYFSSPDVKNPYTGESLGDATHDNVGTLKATYEIVASYRAAKDGTDSAQDEQDATTPTRTITPSGTFAQKTMISGVVKDGSNIVGVIHLTVAKTSKGYSKVSGSMIGLDGKKKAIKAGKLPVEGESMAKVSVKGATVKDFDGTLNVVLGEDGSISNGSLGSFTVENASVGVLASSEPVFTIDEVISASGVDFISEMAYEDQAYFPLPYAGHGEAVKVTGDKWSTLAKAGKLKLKKNKETQTQELIPDMGKDGTKTNLSGLKISFAKKTASFKGSFTAYAIVNSKLKKYKFVVTGVVADGVGKGTAFCKNLGLTVPVSVQ